MFDSFERDQWLIASPLCQPSHASNSRVSRFEWWIIKWRRGERTSLKVRYLRDHHHSHSNPQHTHFPPFSCAFRLHSNFFCMLQLHDNKRKLATRCIKASIDWVRPRLHFNEQRSINLRSREKRVVCYYSFSFSRIHRMLSRQNHHKFVEMAGCELFSRSWIHLNLLICRRSHDSLAASACAFWIMLADSWLKLPNEWF